MIPYFFELYFKPKQGWEKLAKENFTIKELYLRFAIVFAFIPAISHFIGFTVFKNVYIQGIKNFLEMAEKDTQQNPQTVEYMKALLHTLQDNDLTKEIMVMLVTYGFELFKPVVVAILIMFLSGAFGGIKNPNKAFTVAIFSLIPSWAAGAFYAVNSPISMFVLFLASFYTFYLIFIAAEKILGIPSEGSKNFQFIILLIILYLILSGLIGYVESGITFQILKS
ncbi:YIP1 family protein [Hydrogenothermus marinus]|uniref:Yip1-like protein n=1 Tax=Hydrogenothermus marinus TaxID=133270 RepID=A0A3M0BKT7_9AQUI|nr:YIP1 family protein [Hydrogenothermus marinus]RMA97871.1 Yip1-like protein [Hydrogenothermus marinus]